MLHETTVLVPFFNWRERVSGSICGLVQCWKCQLSRIKALLEQTVIWRVTCWNASLTMSYKIHFSPIIKIKNKSNSLKTMSSTCIPCFINVYLTINQYKWSCLPAFCWRKETSSTLSVVMTDSSGWSRERWAKPPHITHARHVYVHLGFYLSNNCPPCSLPAERPRDKQRNIVWRRASSGSEGSIQSQLVWLWAKLMHRVKQRQPKEEEVL